MGAFVYGGMDPGRVVFDISSDEESSGHSEPQGEDFDWLAEFLESDDKETDDDSDDVVVVAEVKPKQKSKSSKPTVRDVDDDCVILDGDPDKPAGVVDDSAGGGEDDLLIVGETGQIACRDYPHPRHHCVTFPFGTTPHEKHCDMCHCYVCDSPAPCVHWATSVTGMHHCHATDKEETWKIERRNFKLGKSAPLPASKVSDTRRPMSLPQLNTVSPHSIVQLSPSLRPQSHVSRPSTVQGCSPASFSLPTILSRGRSQTSLGPGLSMNRFQPRIVSTGQLLGVSHSTRSGKPHFTHSSHCKVSSTTMFKSPGSVGVSLPVNRSPNYSSHNRNNAIAAQCARTPAPAIVLSDLNTIRWGNVNSSTHQRRSEPNFGSTVSNAPTSQPHTFTSTTVPSPNDPHNFYLHGSQFQSDGQSIYQSFNDTLNPVENTFLDGIESASAKDARSVDHSSSWVNNSQSNQQPPVEHPQSVFEPPDKESSPEFSVRNANFNPDFGLDDWLLDSQSAPVVSDGSVPPQSSIFSPEPAPIDTSLLLFDFETSWNGLTRSECDSTLFSHAS